MRGSLSASRTLPAVSSGRAQTGTSPRQNVAGMDVQAVRGRSHVSRDGSCGRTVRSSGLLSVRPCGAARSVPCCGQRLREADMGASDSQADFVWLMALRVLPVWGQPRADRLRLCRLS